MDIEEFFHDLIQNLHAESSAQKNFTQSVFALRVVEELQELGFTEDFVPCFFKRRGMRVDGYSFRDDETTLDLFTVDYPSGDTLETITQTDASKIFKRLESFFNASLEKGLHKDLEESTDGYDLAKSIYKRKNELTKVNLFLLSGRRLSDRLHGLKSKLIAEQTLAYDIWDIARLHRIASSRGGKEELEIDFVEMFGDGVPCLPAKINSEEYESYLLAIPGDILSELYDRYGNRLLEQNVRCFLQARNKVNKGIRKTVLTEPGMFFAYNNGITATAKEIITEVGNKGTIVNKIRDLQIVNGGQTTATIFHARKKDQASLANLFVQMKLSVVAHEESEQVITRMSEYANTQNKVNAADFFSNHPFHIRMEGFSRRLWAPAKQSELRESKWFYERARGQYADAQALLSSSQKNKFLAEYPKMQKYTKTDLAKYENVWDEEPTYVNLGAQKNFVQYAKRIGKMWDRNSNQFNELYYKRAIARAILFKTTDKLVFSQSWYEGGYKANIVAYTLAMLAKLVADDKKTVDFIKIWSAQGISDIFKDTLTSIAKVVCDSITSPPSSMGVTNITEWCKRPACWNELKKCGSKIKKQLDKRFFDELVDIQEVTDEQANAEKDQKVVNGIEAQKLVMGIDGEKWRQLLDEGQSKELLSTKEIGILKVASQIPNKIPSEKQAFVLLQIQSKLAAEGIV